MARGPEKDVDAQRGIHYAETLNVGTVAYPDPEKIKQIHEEWRLLEASGDQQQSPSQ